MFGSRRQPDPNVAEVMRRLDDIAGDLDRHALDMSGKIENVRTLVYQMSDRSYETDDRAR